jgi:hypothetical protein
MRERTIIIVLTVIGAGLIAGIITLKRSESSRNAHAPEAQASDSADGPAPRSKYKAVKQDAGTDAQNAPHFHWTEVESPDYKEYIAKLRDIQCPEETIRDIIIADINKLYAPREAALKVAGDEEASVSEDRTQRVAPFERRKQLRELQKEKNALLKELLGIELPLDPLRARGARSYELFEAAFKALPPEKREVVREIQENYWQNSDALKDKYNNRRTMEYIEEYTRLNVERKAQLANALTPDEMDEYEMRTTNVAQNMRSSMEGFNPTEEEFKKIFRIRKEIEEPFGGLLGASALVDAQGNVNAQNQRSYSDRQKEINEKVKEVLGPERAQQYELSQDSNYRTMRRLGTRFGLSPEVVMQSYELQKTYRDQQRQLRSDPTVPPDQRNAALQQLQSNYEAQFNQLVGEQAAQAYRNNRGNYVESGVVMYR